MAGGVTPKITESDQYYSSSTDGIPFLRVQNLSPAGLCWSDCKYISPETHGGLLNRSKVFEGDLLIKITGVGRMAITSIAPKNFEGNINQHMVVVKTKKPQINDQIATFLNSDIGEMLASRRTTGGTRPALDYKALRSIPIILNDTVSSIMQKAYTQKAEKENQAKELLNSINDYLLQELGIVMPSEEENTLGSRMFCASSNKVSGTRFDPFYHKPTFDANLQNIKNCNSGTIDLKSIINGELIKGILPNESQKGGECKVIQITNINIDGTIDVSNNLTAKPIYLPKHQLKTGDVLVVITGATIGKVGFWEYHGEYYLGGDIIKFNTNNYYLNKIYAALLRTPPYQLQIKKCITGATNGHLALKDIELLPLPNINDKKIQRTLANHLTSIQSEIYRLKMEAQNTVDDAKAQVERILLGGNLSN